MIAILEIRKNAILDIIYILKSILTKDGEKDKGSSVAGNSEILYGARQ